MAVGGQRPKSAVPRLVGGNAGKRPLSANDPVLDGPPEKPPGMDGEAAALWDIRITRAHWLTWADSDKAAMWCILQAEFYAADGAITAARIGRLMTLGSELGFDPSSRARIGAAVPPAGKSKGAPDKFFTRRDNGLRAVVKGGVVAGPHVRNAARRHLDDIAHQAERGLLWDKAEAGRVFRFFEIVLRLAGAKFVGASFKLQPSQQFIVGSLFGWNNAATGKRRIRRAYIEQGKGNGKSPLAAGVGLYCLIADKEARAEVYAAAAKKDQAMVLFRDAVAMRSQSPDLAARLTTSGGNPVWSLADLQTGSFFRPLSSDDSQSGPRPSCALCDELHEHRDGNVSEMLERGFKARAQPLLVMITNSGSDLNSVCWEEHVNAVRAAA